jgi:anti-sigma factor RsiW
VRDRCQEVLARIVEAATGSMPPQAREGIAEHLATCERCREEAALIAATAAHLRDASRFTAPPGFWAEFTGRLNERLADERTPVPVRLRRWLASPRHAWGTLAVTAAAVLAITAAVRFGPAASKPDPVQSQVQTLVTPTMRTTLPSLGEMLDTWRAGLAAETDATLDRGKP